MMRALFLTLALLGGAVLAAGRAGLAVEYGADGFSMRGYAEQILFDVLGVEATSGVMFDLEDGAGPMLTTAVDLGEVRVRLVAAWLVPGGWRVSLLTSIAW